MNNEFIVQSYTTKTITMEKLLLMCLSFSTLSLKNKILFYCDKSLYDILEHLNLPIEIIHDLPCYDGFDTKLDVYKRHVGDNFIHLDSDLYYDDIVSFNNNDVIVGAHERYVDTGHENLAHNVMKKHFINLRDDYPFIKNNIVYAYQHSFFGCKDVDLLNEYIQNWDDHEQANKQILDEGDRFDKDFLYWILEQPHFYSIIQNYDVSIRVFEEDYVGNYHHYVGVTKNQEHNKKDIIEKLKYYNLNLYNELLNIAYTTKFMDNIKAINFKLRGNCFFEDSSKNWNDNIICEHTHFSDKVCEWHFNDVEVLVDNGEFKICEFNNWEGYVLDITNTTIENNKLLTGTDNFIIKKAGKYDIAIMYTIPEYKFFIIIVEK